MKFTCEKFVLESLVHKSGGVLATKDVQPVLKNFLVEAVSSDVDHRLSVIGCDTELSAVSTTPVVDIEEEGRVLLPGSIFKDLIKEAPEGPVCIKMVDNKCIISAGSVEWDLGVGDVTEYPPVPSVYDLSKVLVDKVKFLRAYGKVSYAAARDSLRPSYQLLDIYEGKIRCTDGAQYQQADFECPLNVSIPIRAADQLVNILRVSEEDNFEIADSDNYIAFFVGSDVFLSLKSQHTFAQVDSWIVSAQDNNVLLSADKQELLSAVRRVRVVADKDTNSMVLELSPSHLKLRCVDRYGNSASQDMDVFYEGQNRRMGVHAQFFYNLVKASESGSVNIFLSESLDNRKPLVFKEEGQFGLLSQVKIGD